jgi:hypothetical protein
MTELVSDYRFHLVSRNVTQRCAREERIEVAKDNQIIIYRLFLRFIHPFNHRIFPEVLGLMPQFYLVP